MQVHAALCFVSQRPEAIDRLAVEIELDTVLNTQHHRMLAHALCGARPVQCQDVAPLHRVIAQKAVRHAGLTPGVTCLWNAGARLRRKSFRQFSRYLVEATISEVQFGELLLGPARRCLVHGVTRKSKSKRLMAKVNKAGLAKKQGRV